MICMSLRRARAIFAILFVPKKTLPRLVLISNNWFWDILRVVMISELIYDPEKMCAALRTAITSPENKQTTIKRISKGPYQRVWIDKIKQRRQSSLIVYATL